LGGGTSGIGEAHDGATDEEKLASSSGTAQLVVQQLEQPAQIILSQCH
jgi:hypothetical protein